MDYNFAKVDSGQSERMDCTVLALSTATGLPYDAVYKALALRGRKPEQPFAMTEAWPDGVFVDYRVKQIANDEFSLGRFTRTLGKSGRFIARIKYSGKWVGHVFAIVDGVAYDRQPISDRGAYQRLAQIWQLEAML